ncbi:MAG: DUF3786 domain-containing protein [Euryarchaeota archaeon]|nr:DUF3786 domain-containing protein [Euryarchaeota archaeon]
MSIKQYEGGNYQHILDMAWDALLSRDLKDVARNSNSQLEDDCIVFSSLGNERIVDVSSRVISTSYGKTSVVESILTLHYLDGAVPIIPTGELIPFYQLPGGYAYFKAFKRRIIDKIASKFQHRPKMLEIVGERLDGVRLSFGDASIRLLPFPKIPVTIIIWSGDDEILGSANVLFDSTASMYLPVEDLAEVGSILLRKLSALI